MAAIANTFVRATKVAAVLFLFLLIALLLIAEGLAQEIPAGTLLPVQLNRDIRVGKSPAGQRISARLMQDVSLDGTTLRQGTEIEGRLMESQAASSGSPARLVFSFDSMRVNGRSTHITASLRALASMLAVHNAELPTNLIDDFGSTIHDWNTTQVGGQGVYRGDGVVVSGQEVVAKASSIGEVTGRPILSSPHSRCAHDGAADRDQSFWIFSTDACGLYGFSDYQGRETLKLSHAGQSEPIGNIVLESQGKLELRGGSGLLLIVQPGPAQP
jgi:hypothetical protein